MQTPLLDGGDIYDNEALGMVIVDSGWENPYPF